MRHGKKYVAIILEEIRSSLRSQRQEYQQEIAELRAEVRGQRALPSVQTESQTQSLPPAQPQPQLTQTPPLQLTPAPSVGAFTPGSFPLSDLLRTDLRPVLSPRPAVSLTFETPVQTATASAALPSRLDVPLQSEQQVVEQIMPDQPETAG